MNDKDFLVMLKILKTVIDGDPQTQYPREYLCDLYNKGIEHLFQTQPENITKDMLKYSKSLGHIDKNFLYLFHNKVGYQLNTESILKDLMRDIFPVCVFAVDNSRINANFFDTEDFAFHIVAEKGSYYVRNVLIRKEANLLDLQRSYLTGLQAFCYSCDNGLEIDTIENFMPKWYAILKHGKNILRVLDRKKEKLQDMLKQGHISISKEK